MRSELISAEVYAMPSMISSDSKRVSISCGSHILTHSLKTGKLISSSISILAKPTSLVQRNNQLIISNVSGSKTIDGVEGVNPTVSSLGGYQVVSTFGNVSVVVTQSSESGQVALGYIAGDLSASSKIVIVFSGHVSSIGSSADLIVAVTGVARRNLIVFDVKSGSMAEYHHNRALTATAVHPQSEQVAAGDCDGRIMRWSDVRSLGSYSSSHHWHSVPVASMCYSSNGSVLLSGAEEGVLCIWNDSSSDSKPQFIPRLGGPIAHLSVSKCNQFVAVSITNNRIVIVDLFTRSVQAVIPGTLHDGEHAASATQVHAIPDNDSVIAISTPSHVQLFDMDSRRAVNKSLISVQERNHIPSTIRAKVKAQPWECCHVAVLTSDPKAWYMMASLSRSVRRGPNKQMVKVFKSVDAGANWKLHTVCVGAHSDEIIGVEALVAVNGFVTAGKDGSVKLWKLGAGEEVSKTSVWAVVKSVGFRNQTPTFLSVAKEGVVIAGFGKYVTVMNPNGLAELTGGLLLSADVVFAGLIQGSTDLYAVGCDGSVSLWDLKKCTKTSEAKIELTGSCAAVVGSTLLVAAMPGELVTITLGKKSKLTVKQIAVPEESGNLLETLVGLTNTSVIATCRKNVYRFNFAADATETPFREPDEMGPEDVHVAEDEHVPQQTEERQARRVFAPMSSIVGKLFPMEDGLDTLGSPEEQFSLLMLRGGLVPTIAC